MENKITRSNINSVKNELFQKGNPSLYGGVSKELMINMYDSVLAKADVQNAQQCIIQPINTVPPPIQPITVLPPVRQSWTNGGIAVNITRAIVYDSSQPPEQIHSQLAKIARVTSNVGLRTLNGKTRMHYGVDYAMRNVTLKFDGFTVTKVKWDGEGYGRYAIMKNVKVPGLTLLVAHLGNNPRKGTGVIVTGNSGPVNTTWHLHIEVIWNTSTEAYYVGHGQNVSTQLPAKHIWKIT